MFQIWDYGGGGGAKSTQSLLTFSFNNPLCGAKFQGHTYSQSQIIELEARAPFKKIGFSGQN